MRKELDNNLNYKEFMQYYYLKEELVLFCKKNNLKSTGSKIELTNRIKCFLNNEKIEEKTIKKIKNKIDNITLDSIIEDNFVCSEKHRIFYKKYIGNSFKFNVLFQNWLKNNSGKTYKDSIDEYYKILKDKKNNKTNIDKQFEYNKYIRDFFNDNKNLKLDSAIKCWKYKKSVKGSNKYEKEDLKILYK